jgi:hypothetical protein
LYRRAESSSNETTGIRFHSSEIPLRFLLTSIWPIECVREGVELLSPERSATMNLGKHMEAIRQYRVLIDDVDDSTAEERAEAAAHREEYGGEYIPARRHGPENAALLLRFMHEVHGIPLAQASQSVIEFIRDQDVLRFNGHDPVAVATGLLRTTGNVLVAAATASLYMEAAKGTAFEQSWQEVSDALWHAELVEDEAEPTGKRTLH